MVVIMDETPNSHAVRRFLDALESGVVGEELAAHWTGDVETITHPNALAPSGSRADRAAMIAASRSGAALLSHQRYEIHDLRAVDDLVIARITWTGEVAADAGGLRAGQTLTAQLAQFFDLRAGRIARIETFDCYQPLGA